MNIVQSSQKLSRQNIEFQKLTFGKTDKKSGRTLSDAVGSIECLKHIQIGELNIGLQSGLEIRTQNTERRPNAKRLIVLILSHFGLHFVWFLFGKDQTKNLWLALTVLNINFFLHKFGPL